LEQNAVVNQPGLARNPGDNATEERSSAVTQRQQRPGIEVSQSSGTTALISRLDSTWRRVSN